MSDEDEGLEFITAAERQDMNGNQLPSNNREQYHQQHMLGFIRQSKHPYAAFFHILFRFLALFCYLFASAISSSFVFMFVIIILLLAFDFWTVKNITGRLLVGLRWWNYVKDDGENEWIFESLEDMNEINPMDSQIFWMSLYVTPFLWIGLFITGLLKLEFQWLIIVVVALIMNTANIIGYTKCSNDAKEKVSRLMQEGAMRGAMGAMGNSGFRNILFSLFGGGGNGNNNNSNTQRV